MTSDVSSLDGSERPLDDQAPALLVVGPGGRIEYANQVAERFYGRSAEELVGRPLEVVSPPGPRGIAGYVMANAGSTDERRTRVQVLREDGTPLTVDVRLTPMQSPGRTMVAAADASRAIASEQRLIEVNRSYLTLAQINQAMLRAATPEELYAETCRIAVEVGGYLGAWIIEPGPDHSVLTVAQAGELDDYISRLAITTDPDHPHGNGPTGRALREGSPYYCDDFLHDPTTAPWHEAARLYGIRASATVPLRRQGRTVAVINLWAREPDIGEQMRALLGNVGENVSFALDAFDYRQRLVRTAAERSNLLSRLVAAQEEERGRIAADVHDDSVQSLAAIELRLGLLRRRAAALAPDLEPDLEQLQEITARVAVSLRDLLFDLEPIAPDADLVDAVRDSAAHLLDDTAMTWSLTVNQRADQPARPSEEVVVQALRITREAIINARKHAEGANRIEITMSIDDEGCEVAISDDGRGVDTVPEPRPGHRGLVTMHDRAEIVGGWCRFESSSATGTTVRFWMPCRHDDPTAPGPGSRRG